MERGSFKLFKECSEVAIVEKEELKAMKSGFEELHRFLSMQSDIFSSEGRTKEAEFQRISKQPRDFIFMRLFIHFIG